MRAACRIAIARPFALGAALVLLLAPVVSAAQEGAERRFSWRPSVQVQGVFNDNIKLSDDQKASDFGAFLLPRVEAAYRAPAFELGVDGAVDVRRYTGDSNVDEVFYRVDSFAEAGIVPGLVVRLGDVYTPQPIVLGLPEDEPANLLQTNRARLELRYWREFWGGREVVAGIAGTRFDTESFATPVEGPGGGVALDPSFRADFWDGSGLVELRNPIGEHHAAYLRGMLRQRLFDDGDGGDHLDARGLIGFRSDLPAGLSFDVAGGWGWLDFSEHGSESQWLGRAELRWRGPGGWRFDLGAHHERTIDLAGNDFEDSTGRIGIERFFGKRTAAGVVLFLSYLEGDSASPRSNLFGGAELKVRRQLTRRVEASLAYRYWENAGAFDGDDMRQNRVMLALTYRH